MNLRRALKDPMGGGKKKAAAKKAPKAAAAPSADLFVWIDALYNKSRPEGSPPMYVIHRFLASDQLLASAARTLQQEVREAPLIYRTWQGLLGVGKGAPRFQYAAAKKGPPEEELVARMERVLGENRRSVESMLLVMRAAGREQELYREFGIKPPVNE